MSHSLPGGTAKRKPCPKCGKPCVLRAEQCAGCVRAARRAKFAGKSTRHPCHDCGKLCRVSASRCVPCARKHADAQRGGEPSTVIGIGRARCPVRGAFNPPTRQQKKPNNSIASSNVIHVLGENVDATSSENQKTHSTITATPPRRMKLTPREAVKARFEVGPVSKVVQPERAPTPPMPGRSGGDQAFPKRETVAVSRSVQGHVTLW